MYKHLLSHFKNYSVLVIGDLILDIYLSGASNRLTDEGPVPVVDIMKKYLVPGGAANTAINLKNLGAQVTLCSVTGDDEGGRQAQTMLEQACVHSQLLSLPARSTMVKTRVISGQQLLLRFDNGSDKNISGDHERAFIELIAREYFLHDAIIVADYGLGLITPGILKTLEALRKEDDRFLAVDSKRLHLFKPLRPSLIKPNYEEIVQLLQLEKRYTNRMLQVSQVGNQLYETTGAAISAVTLDSEGSAIFSGSTFCYQCNGLNVTAPNVAGAGDTYISTFLLAYLASGNITESAEISSVASTIAISKDNTASCSAAELDAYISINEKYIADEEQLISLILLYRNQKKKIVFTNGCFDILHSGHVNYLSRARELGHVLIVGINNDESIKRLKGTDRPINELHERVAVLAGLGAVSHIIPFGNITDDTAGPLIQLIKPDIFVKGADYKREQLPEAVLMDSLGGEIVLLPLIPDRSTSLILERISQKHPIG